MRSVTSNKQVFTVLLIVPIVLTIALPSIFVFVISFAPDAASDFQKLLDMLPAPNGEYSQQQQIFSLILNQIMPSFFLIIPIMASSVMAASSFVSPRAALCAACSSAAPPSCAVSSCMRLCPSPDCSSDCAAAGSFLNLSMTFCVLLSI